MAQHFEVVVVGSSLGALAAAALLATRSWRVLVVPHHDRTPGYAFEDVPLLRRPSTAPALASGIWSRILMEITDAQTFQRRLRAVDPMMQIVGPKLRFDFARDRACVRTELERAFGDVARHIEGIYEALAKLNESADAVLAGEAIAPPGTFWERQKAISAWSSLPNPEDPYSRPWLLALPDDHPFRVIFDLPSLFATYTYPASALGAARAHALVTRGLMEFSAGEESLRTELVQKIEAQGGTVRARGRVTRIGLKKRQIVNVVVDDEDPVATSFIVTSLAAREAMALAGQTLPARSFPLLGTSARRFSMSVVVREEGVPVRLSRESFLLSEWPQASEAPAALHVQRHDLDGEHEGLVRLDLELNRTTSSSYAREQALRILERQLPFIEQHYVVVDSVYDGRPLWDFRSGTRREIDRTSLRTTGGEILAEPMPYVYALDQDAWRHIAGEPLRFPVEGLFGIGPSIVPGLGQEGELLAACGVTQLISKTDQKRERMRKELWSKLKMVK